MKKTKFISKLIFISVLIITIIILFNKGENISFSDKRVLSYTEKSSFPSDVYGTPVYTAIIDEGPARPMTKRKIKYIVIHETDNFIEGVGAHNHANFLSHNNTSTTSWHYTVDDHEIYHHIPDNEIAYHAGEKVGNEYGIGIELCVNADGDFDKTFENGAKLVAYLIKEYDLDITALKTHHDFSGKDCPHQILSNNRLSEFQSKVEYYLNLK